MAADDVFNEVGGQLVEKIFSGVLWFGIAVIIIFVLGFSMWYFLIYKKKFDIKIKVISERANSGNVEIYDKGAILTDNTTRTPYLRVWGLKRDFTVPKYDVMRKVYENGRDKDYIEIYRKGEEEFYFLTPPSISKTSVIKSDGKMYAISDQTQIMVDPEMAFWAIKRKTLNKKMFNTEGLLFKLLPYIGVLMGGVIMIFLLYILLDHLPGILGELKGLVSEMRLYYRADIVTGGVLASLKWKKK